MKDAKWASEHRLSKFELSVVVDFKQSSKTFHSVLERIWVKGSYLSQWLPQGERGPPKESKSQWIESLHIGSH